MFDKYHILLWIGKEDLVLCWGVFKIFLPPAVCFFNFLLYWVDFAMLNKKKKHVSFLVGEVCVVRLSLHGFGVRWCEGQIIHNYYSFTLQRSLFEL